MAMKYVRIFHDSADVINELSDEGAGQVLKAVMEYSKTGQQIDLMLPERVAFIHLRSQIDRDIAAYEKKVSANHENGKLGGRPRKQEEKPTENPVGFSETQTNPQKPTKRQNKEKDKEEEQEIYMCGDSNESPTPTKPKPKSQSSRFKPPTVDEVAAYCTERRNSVNAERFINHYTANGWMVGKTKMKDWKAAVRNWEDDLKPTAYRPSGLPYQTKKVQEQQYQQRHYDPNELDGIPEDLLAEMEKKSEGYA